MQFVSLIMYLYLQAHSFMSGIYNLLESHVIRRMLGMNVDARVEAGQNKIWMDNVKDYTGRKDNVTTADIEERKKKNDVQVVLT